MLRLIDHRAGRKYADWVHGFYAYLKNLLEPVKFQFEPDVTKPMLSGVKCGIEKYYNDVLKPDRKNFRSYLSFRTNPEFTNLKIYDSSEHLMFEVIEEAPPVKGKIYGYARVSSKKQDLTAQVNALKNAYCDYIYQEKYSAKADFRPQFEILLNQLKKNDMLVVWRLDRLGRTMFELITLISELEKRGIKFCSLTENIDTTTLQGKLFLTLNAYYAEMELNVMKERQEAKKEIDRKNGKRGGRPQGITDRTKDLINPILKMSTAKEPNGELTFSVRTICKTLKISTKTYYKCLELAQNKEQHRKPII